MPTDANTVTLTDIFIAPCPSLPKGAYVRKLGDRVIEASEGCPVVFLGWPLASDTSNSDQNKEQK